jgi:hypothetical protein
VRINKKIIESTPIRTISPIIDIHKQELEGVGKIIGCNGKILKNRFGVRIGRSID